MIGLPETHPQCYAELRERGQWTVQRQDQHGFASIACDQAIEQTVNRDSKTSTGITNFSLDRAAVHRWILSQNERAAITRQCQTLAGSHSESRRRKDLDTARTIRDERHIQNLMSTITSMMDPFDPKADLVSISSGIIASPTVKHDLLNAYETGEHLLCSFMESRLLTNTVDFYSILKAQKLKTFTAQVKSTSTVTSKKEITLKADRNLFARLLIIGQTRQLDMRGVLSYSLSPVSLPLASADGSLAKTNKSALMDLMERRVDNVLALSMSDDPAVIVDGVAVIQGLVRIPETFLNLAQNIQAALIQIMVRFGSSRIDFVCDRYPDISIKNAEHSRRSTQGTCVTRLLYGPDQKVPSQWKKFLASGKNKEALIDFLFTTWRSTSLPNLGRDYSIYVTHSDQCHVLKATSGEVCVQFVDELQCDHEEADTRLMLHAKHASSSYRDIVIHSSDTDVAVIAVALGVQIQANLFFSTGVKNRARVIDIGRIRSNLGEELSQALIGFHILTGCDSTSCFYGKGKKKDLFSHVQKRDFRARLREAGVRFRYSSRNRDFIGEVRLCYLRSRVGSGCE